MNFGPATVSRRKNFLDFTGFLTILFCSLISGKMVFAAEVAPTTNKDAPVVVVYAKNFPNDVQNFNSDKLILMSVISEAKVTEDRFYRRVVFSGHTYERWQVKFTDSSPCFLQLRTSSLEYILGYVPKDMTFCSNIRLALGVASENSPAKKRVSVYRNLEGSKFYIVTDADIFSPEQP